MRLVLSTHPFSQFAASLVVILFTSNGERFSAKETLIPHLAESMYAFKQVASETPTGLEATRPTPKS